MFLAINKAVTLLGSAALLLPASGVLAATLWKRYSPLTAGRWLAALALCIVVVALSKIAGHACGFHLAGDRLTSPSGHAALSAAVYGSAGLVVARELSGWRRPALLLGVAGLVAAVALSRVVLHRHSVTEVAVGLMLGTLAVAAVAPALGRLTPSRFEVNPLAAAVVVLFGALTVTLGDRPIAEPLLYRAAHFLQRESLLCGPVPPLRPPHVAFGHPPLDLSAPDLRMRADEG